VADVVAAPGWVVDGNYSAVRDLVWDRADTVVWLDLPRRLVMRRIILRTVRRAVTRERLWNDNREPLANLYRLDPEKNIIRWAWVRHAVYVERYDAAMHDSAFDHLPLREVAHHRWDRRLPRRQPRVRSPLAGLRRSLPAGAGRPRDRRRLRCS
jgi:adenylate kinase family enzyme